MLQRFVDAASVEAEIARVRSLFGDALRRRWQSVFGRSPPDSLTPDLLRRMIANRIQEQAFGTLDRATLKLLDGLARREGARTAERNLKIGTVLVQRLSGPAPHRHGRARRLCLGGQSLFQPVGDRTRHHRDGLSGPRFFAVKSSGDRKNDPLDAARGQRRRRHPTEPR
jgi:hypothetical protein